MPIMRAKPFAPAAASFSIPMSRSSCVAMRSKSPDLRPISLNILKLPGPKIFSTASGSLPRTNLRKSSLLPLNFSSASADNFCWSMPCMPVSNACKYLFQPVPPASVIALSIGFLIDDNTSAVKRCLAAGSNEPNISSIFWLMPALRMLYNARASATPPLAATAPAKSSFSPCNTLSNCVCPNKLGSANLLSMVLMIGVTSIGFRP